MFCTLFMQAIVIIVSFSYSSIIIKDSFEDWNNNPILTTTEEIGASLTEVDFPTVTICHEPKYQVDNWALPELVLNFFSFECRKSFGKYCNVTDPLRNDFKDLMAHLANSINLEINADEYDETKLIEYLFEKKYNVFGRDIWRWQASNQTSINQIEELLETSIGKFGSPRKDALLAVSLIKGFIRKQLKLKSIKAPTCEGSCVEYYGKLTKLWLKALALSTGKIGIGTLYRKVAPYLGITHKLSKIKTEYSEESRITINGDYLVNNGTVGIFYIKFKGFNAMGFDCNSITEIEAVVHSINTRVGLLISGHNVTLNDYPNFFKVEGTEEEQGRQVVTYPIYSWCKHWPAVYEFDGFEEFGIKWCPPEWYKTNHNSKQVEENPYIRLPKDFCTKGTSEITGSKLETIYKVMKFAYHLNTEEDTHELYDKVKESKPQYEMISYEDFNKTWISNWPYFINSLGFANKFYQPILTNIGLCFAWNHRSISEVFKQSNALKGFMSKLNGNNTTDGIAKASIKKIELFLDKQEVINPDRIKSPKSFW